MESHVEQLITAMETRNPHQLSCTFSHAFECSSCLGIYWCILDALAEHADTGSDLRPFATKLFLVLATTPYIHSLLDGLFRILGRLRTRKADADLLFDASNLSSWLRLAALRNPDVPAFLASLPDARWSDILDLAVALYSCRDDDEPATGETASAALASIFHSVGLTIARTSGQQQFQAVAAVRRHKEFSAVLEDLADDRGADPGLATRALTILDLLNVSRSSTRIKSPPRLTGTCGYFFCDVVEDVDASLNSANASPVPTTSTTAAPFRICDRCKLTRYCSYDCQREDWRWHKVFCAKRELPRPNVLKLPKGWDQDGHFAVMKQVEVLPESPEPFSPLEDDLDRTPARGGPEASLLSPPPSKHSTLAPIRTPAYDEYGIELEVQPSPMHHLSSLAPVPARFDESSPFTSPADHALPFEPMDTRLPDGGLLRSASRSGPRTSEGLGRSGASGASGKLSASVPITPPASANRSFSTGLGVDRRSSTKSVKSAGREGERDREREIEIVREVERGRRTPPPSGSQTAVSAIKRFTSVRKSGNDEEVSRRGREQATLTDSGYASRARSASRGSALDSDKQSARIGTHSRRSSAYSVAAERDRDEEKEEETYRERRTPSVRRNRLAELEEQVAEILGRDESGKIRGGQGYVRDRQQEEPTSRSFSRSGSLYGERQREREQERPMPRSLSRSASTYGDREAVREDSTSRRAPSRNAGSANFDQDREYDDTKSSSRRQSVATTYTGMPLSRRPSVATSRTDTQPASRRSSVAASLYGNGNRYDDSDQDELNSSRGRGRTMAVEQKRNVGVRSVRDRHEDGLDDDELDRYGQLDERDLNGYRGDRNVDRSGSQRIGTRNFDPRDKELPPPPPQKQLLRSYTDPVGRRRGSEEEDETSADERGESIWSPMSKYGAQGDPRSENIRGWERKSEPDLPPPAALLKTWTAAAAEDDYAVKLEEWDGGERRRYVPAEKKNSKTSLGKPTNERDFVSPGTQPKGFAVGAVADLERVRTGKD
ncbi:hypothetical protein HDU93_008678, partial [Gonapodya sp. JEL0774]